MRKYSLFAGLPLSFYSKDLYRDIGQNWPGMGFLYLISAVTLFLIPIILKLFTVFAAITLSDPVDFNYIIDQVPQVVITQGEVKADVEQPYFIRAREMDKPLAVIDTTKPVSEWTQDPKHPMFVLGKNQLLMIDDDKHENKLTDLPKDLTHTYDKDDVRALAEVILSYSWVAPVVLSIFLVPCLFIYRIIQVLIYGGLGLGLARLMRVELEYEDSVRLACVAITPALALDALAPLLFHSHIGILWYFLLAMGYLGFAIRANKT